MSHSLETLSLEELKAAAAETEARMVAFYTQYTTENQEFAGKMAVRKPQQECRHNEFTAPPEMIALLDEKDGLEAKWIELDLQMREATQ